MLVIWEGRMLSRQVVYTGNYCGLFGIIIVVYNASTACSLRGLNWLTRGLVV